MTLKNQVGKRIKELRGKRKISQEKLAEMAEISQNMLSGIETGNNFCSAETLEKIIIALDVEPNELFDFGHQRDNNELLNDINKILSKNPEKLKEIYKIIRAVVN
ncbi:helix-turn-helix transcriptional regulator [bacterium]|nr:helix-turn-helix transcriptional regulator [bacterium]